MFFTNRLRLRPITIEDVDAMLATRTIPELVAFTYEPIWTREYASQRISTWVEIQAQKKPDFTRWMIERKDDATVIGDIFLSNSDELHGSTEIGYVIHPDFAGNGFATEAAQQVLRVGFEDWKVHRVYARVDAENIGSMRVCQRLGMRQEARLIESDKRGDVWSTELVFAMLDREWTEMYGK